MADIFISYSRRNQEQVVNLYEALRSAGFDPWIDLEILPAIDWMDNIERQITAANALLCVISPDFIDSDICQKELEIAISLHKKVIPVQIKDVVYEEVNNSIRAIQWILFLDTSDLTEVVEKVRVAYELDLEFEQQSAALLQQALKWSKKGQSPSFLLRGDALIEAEQWRTLSEKKEKVPLPIQLDLINDSRFSFRRQQRRQISLLSISLTIFVVLSIISTLLFQLTHTQNNQLIDQAQTLRAQVLAGQVSTALLSNNIDRALLFGVAATHQRNMLDTRNALYSALSYDPYIKSILQSNVADGTTTDPIIDIGYGSGGTIMAATEGGKITVWKESSRRQIMTFHINSRLEGAQFSPDGSFVAVRGIGAEAGISLWNVSKGAKVVRLEPETAPTLYKHHGLAFSSDSKRLAFTECIDSKNSFCPEIAIKVWDSVTHTTKTLLKIDNDWNKDLYIDDNTNLVDLAWSANGKTIAIASCRDLDCTENRVEVWDLSGARKLLLSASLFNGSGILTSLAFSNDSSLLAVGGCSGTNTCAQGRAVLINLSQKNLTYHIITTNTESVQSLVFTPDDSSLIVGSTTGTLQFIDVASYKPNSPVLSGHQLEVNTLVFSHSGQNFASASDDGQIILWRLAPFSALAIPIGNNRYGQSEVALSTNGKLLVTGAPNASEAPIIITEWDITSGKLLKILKGSNEDTFGDRGTTVVALSKDGQYVASGNYSNNLYWWNLRQRQIKEFKKVLLGPIAGITISADNRHLAASDVNGLTAVWSTSTGKMVHDFFEPNDSKHYVVGAQSFSPDGSVLAVGSGNKVVLWNVVQNRQIGLLSGAYGAIKQVAFQPSGKVIGALTENGDVIFWNSANGKVEQTFSTGSLNISGCMPAAHCSDLVFSADGKLLVAAYDRSIVLIDTSSINQLQLLIRPIIVSKEVINIALTPDAQFMAIAYRNGPIEVRPASLLQWQRTACQIANRDFTTVEIRQDLAGTAIHASCKFSI